MRQIDFWILQCKNQKKMSEASNRLAVSSAYAAANFLPATLKTNKSGWLIEYYVENPQTQQLARKKIRLARLMNFFAFLLFNTLNFFPIAPPSRNNF